MLQACLYIVRSTRTSKGGPVAGARVWRRQPTVRLLLSTALGCTTALQLAHKPAGNALEAKAAKASQLQPPSSHPQPVLQPQFTSSSPSPHLHHRRLLPSPSPSPANSGPSPSIRLIHAIRLPRLAIVSRSAPQGCRTSSREQKLP
ncbi:hypothetical protein J3F83DRAFT_353421 [Trichoderma novae-zelandiae]